MMSLHSARHVQGFGDVPDGCLHLASERAMLVNGLLLLTLLLLCCDFGGNQGDALDGVSAFKVWERERRSGLLERNEE